MIQLSKQESLRILQMWNDYGVYLDEIFMRMIKGYETNLQSNAGDQWFNARQMVEYLAKKQTLIDLKKLFSNRYE